jgi:uncharacterized protein DUF4440
MAFKQLVTFAAALIALGGNAVSGSVPGYHFEDRYAALKVAMERKDETAIRSVLADGFVSVGIDGKSLDAAQMMKEVLALPNDPNRQSHTTILSVRGDEHAAVVKQRYDMTTKVKDSDGSEKSATISTVSTDNWINVNGSWRVVRTVTNQLDATVDGKSVAHKMNPMPN